MKFTPAILYQFSKVRRLLATERTERTEGVILSLCSLCPLWLIIHSISPPRQHAARRESRADSGEQGQVTFFQFAAVNRVADGQRDGRRGRIAVLMNVFDDLVLIEADLVCGGVNDPEVSLVGDERADVG